MKLIIKNKEPNKLLEYKKKEAADYNTMKLDVKDDLKENLLLEQGYICCYCMQRISKEKMKVEHRESQSEFPKKQLDYKNMFAACKGNEKKGNKKNVQTCDTRKGEQVLTINPLKKEDMDTINYTIDGKILSTNPTYDVELNEVLNLNFDVLVNARKEAISTIADFLIKKRPTGNWSKTWLQSIIDKYSALNKDNKHECFFGAILYHLERKKKRAV